MVEIVELVHTMRQDSNVMKLVSKMLAGDIGEVKPTLDLSSELGFAYPQVESLLAVSSQEVLTILGLLADESVLQRQFHDKLLFCPHCRSLNLRPILICPKCGSGNIAKGRVLEHFSCANIGLEDEYAAAGKYICPKCNKELRFLGTDYRSLGVNYKCHNCGEIFSEAALKWQCLKCSILFTDGEAKKTVLYSYRINEEQRHLLGFELGPKARFVEFLKSQGYEVTERAKVDSVSKSGAGHTIDILARRDDGLVTYTIGVGIVIDSNGREIGLEEVFRFDDKAYDLGIHDKVLLVMPRLTHEAKQFALRQRIKVFEDKELETFLASATPSTRPHMKTEPFKFDTKAKLLEHLKNLGYEVQEKAKVQGRSGVEHTLDILAYNDDGFITHTLGIGIIRVNDGVNLDAVSLFDTKAYDIGIHDKVLLVSPNLSQEAKQFAQQQRIRVVEVEDPVKLV